MKRTTMKQVTNMEAPTTMKRLTDPKIWNASQSWNYEAMWEVAGRRVRVSMRRNAYDEQSHIRANVFDPTTAQWNALCSTPFAHADASLKALSYVQREAPSARVFEADEVKILSEALIILDVQS